MKKLLIIFFLTVSGLTLSNYCFAEEKIEVAVTILPLAEFTEKVGGALIDVTIMIPPGGNPHTYEPTPKQLVKLSHARMYVKVGSGVEFELAWMDKLIAQNPGMKICNASQGIQLIDMADQKPGGKRGEHHEKNHRYHHGGKDPHVWLSPLNAIVMVGNIRDAFIKIDPANENIYRQNATRYIAELDSLKKEIKQQLSTLENRNFLIFHPAWGYFAQDFNLTQLAAEHCGKEPSPRQLANVINQAKSNHIKIIFASPQFSQKSAKVIANEIKGKVVSLNPLEKNYINNLRKASKTLSIQ